MCYCDEYKTRLCRCVAERDYGKDDAAPTIFRGFPHNLDVSLSGTWRSFCEPIVRLNSEASVREFHNFSFSNSTGSRVYNHERHEYNDYKCSEEERSKTIFRSGSYK